MEKSLMNISKCQKPLWDGYILYDSNYMNFWKSQSYREAKKKWSPKFARK
jgi:hypothetical protein